MIPRESTGEVMDNRIGLFLGRLERFGSDINAVVCLEEQT